MKPKKWNKIEKWNARAHIHKIDMMLTSINHRIQPVATTTSTTTSIILKTGISTNKQTNNSNREQKNQMRNKTTQTIEMLHTKIGENRCCIYLLSQSEEEFHVAGAKGIDDGNSKSNQLNWQDFYFRYWIFRWFLFDFFFFNSLRLTSSNAIQCALIEFYLSRKSVFVWLIYIYKQSSASAFCVIYTILNVLKSERTETKKREISEIFIDISHQTIDELQWNKKTTTKLYLMILLHLCSV